MVNRVTVAAVSAFAQPYDEQVKPADVVDRMIALWGERLETVVHQRPDLLVLPEYCDRPYVATYPRELLEEYYALRGDRIRDFFAEKAAEFGINIAYSASRDTPAGRFNSTQFLGRDGAVVGVYDKCFITDGEKSVMGVTPGAGARTVQLDFGTVAGAICFDLNFEELLADVARLHPDLVVFSSAFHGGYLQSHWAYTARAHFVGAIYPPSKSAVLNPFGEVISTSTNYRHETIAEINLDSALIHIDFNGVKFNAIRREYGRDVRIHDPGSIGAVMISSEREGLSIDDVIDRFELVRLDDYFTRVRTFRPAAEPA